MIIVAPADNFETDQAVRLAAKSRMPVYIRLGKKEMPFLCEGIQSFEFGRGCIITEGSDVSIIASGETVYPAYQAAKLLEQIHNIKATVVSMHTIKPLDTDLLDRLAVNGSPIITVEEHMVNGGLGEACASYLLQNGVTNLFKIMGIPDEYTVTGSQLEIFDHYGISAVGISAQAVKLMKKAIL
jgi:transketolase